MKLIMKTVYLGKRARCCLRLLYGRGARIPKVAKDTANDVELHQRKALRSQSLSAVGAHRRESGQQRLTCDAPRIGNILVPAVSVSLRKRISPNNVHETAVGPSMELLRAASVCAS